MGIELIFRKNPKYGLPGEPEMLPPETVVTDTPALPLSLDAFDFKKRFTVNERIAIRAAAASSGAVYDFLDMLDTAGMTGTRIVANDELLNAALEQLTRAGLLEAGRKEAILGQEIHVPV